MDNPKHFEQRRHTDPQGVIDDLVAQTSRRGKAIHDLNKKVKQLELDIENLESDLEEQENSGAGDIEF